jgi:limonene-1,2-epoxide hydrolase
MTETKARREWRLTMTKDAVEQVWNSYLEAYGNVAPEKRARLLRESVSDDVVSTNPGEEIQGFANLLAHVDQFQQRLPGAHFKIDKLSFHHDQVLTEWTLYKSDETPMRTAHTYGVFDDQGRLKKLIGFF